MLDFILTPVIGAIIGYFTNWLAIKMLFKPHREYRFLGVRVPFTPGLIPKERRTLAQKIGEVTAKNVLTDDALNEMLRSEEMREKLRLAADGLFERLAKNTAQAGSLIPGGFPDEERLTQFSARASEFLNEHVKLFDYTNISGASGVFIKLLESPDFKGSEVDESLRRFVKKIAEENFGKFLGIFIHYDKIYDNIKNGVVEYLKSEDNLRVLSDKVSSYTKSQLEPSGMVYGLLVKLLNIPVCELMDKLTGSGLDVKKFVLDAADFALKAGGSYVVKNIDLGSLIEDKINGFEMAEVEEIIFSVVKRELSAITWLGALLGLIIGFVPALLDLL